MSTVSLPMPSVAIVVPVYRPLTRDEQISWRHLQYYLGQYPCILLMPNGLDAPVSGFQEVRFDSSFFKCVQSYSRLLLTRKFYQQFQYYSHILIYQLDSLVFSDQLPYWCEAGYDYLGAPWFQKSGDPNSGFSRVGNGGFSLRRVEGFLNVIDSQRYAEHSVSVWNDFWNATIPDLHSKSPFRRFLKRLSVLRSVRQGSQSYRAGYTLNEDHFWSDRARLFRPTFKVAPVEAGLRFAFEQAPHRCFEKNDRQLPFGAHAWSRWNRSFWQEYVLD